MGYEDSIYSASLISQGLINEAFGCAEDLCGRASFQCPQSIELSRLLTPQTLSMLEDMPRGTS